MKLFITLGLGFLLSFEVSAQVGNQIDLSNWKLTLPVDENNDGRPDEYTQPELNNFRDIESIKPYMYEDGKALVFYCPQSNISTPNSKYPRTELREQLVPGKNNVNWTMTQGGRMAGTLQVSRISEGARTIVMQIHGRLTNEQKETIGQKDNDAPPLLKIYHQKNRVRVVAKELVNKNASDLEILNKKSWKDRKAFYFNKVVNNNKFELRVIASEGRLEVRMNDESIIFDDADMQRWPFENYFKAGNYFQTRDPDTFAEVRYYSLSVTH